MAGKQTRGTHEERKDWDSSQGKTAGHGLDDLLLSDSAKTPNRGTGALPVLRGVLAALARRSHMPGGSTADHFKDCASCRFHYVQVTAGPSG
jgi:hypothetical protein